MEVLITKSEFIKIMDAVTRFHRWWVSAVLAMIRTPRIRGLSPLGLAASVLVILFAGLAVSASGASALSSTLALHPVSIVEANVYVDQGRTAIRLTCFAEDLELLQGIQPGENGLYDSDEIREATQDHAEYLAEKIVVRDKDGVQLSATVTNITGVEIPDSGIKSGTLMEYTMGFELEIEYDKAPQFLTLEQQMVAEGALLPSELKVVVKQSGAENSYRKMMKPGIPATFRFDWENPPLSPEASKEEWDNWFDNQEEQALGIVSYGSVYSFIYITDREVRHEVLIPLATLASMMEFDLEDPSFMSVDEQVVAAKKIEAFFGVGNPVTIDGVTVTPLFDRVNFYGLDLRDFAQQPESRRVSMASGRVGVIMNYPAKTPPQSVTVEWSTFNDLIRSVDAVVFAYKDVQSAKFSTFLESNVYRWEAAGVNALPVIVDVDLEDPRYFAPRATFGLPVVTLICLLAASVASVVALTSRSSSQTAFAVGCVLAGVGLMAPGMAVLELPMPFERAGTVNVNPQTADRVFDQLHTNLFRAFDYSQDQDVYDALAISVHGPLLRNLFLQINNSLRIEEQGGAVANIEQVQRLSGQFQRDTFVENGFRYRSKWNIVGTIEHWGHIHQRTNQYDAQFDVQIVDGDWKLTSMEILDQPQGVVKTRLRRF